MSLNNKVVLVTGGGQGIGACIAREYAKEGAYVIIADLDEEAGKENEQYIRGLGLHARYIQTDISEESSVKFLMKEISQIYGKLDILVNNAGISNYNKNISSQTLEDWNRVLAVNLTGPYVTIKHALSIMNQDMGSIINIVSIRAFMSEPNSEPYTASKGGLLALTHSLAVSLGPKIRVNAISPGWIDVSNWKKQKDRKFIHLSEKDHSQHPAGRVGKPEDVAYACIFLSSDKAEFITGTNLMVDGGMTIKMIYE